MGPLDLLLHLLNFVAPAVAVGTLVAIAGRFSQRKVASAHGLPALAAINTVAGAAALVAGLLLFGRDGKMATYAALVVACASSQWLLSRAWKP